MSGTAIQIVRLSESLSDDFQALRQEAANEGYRFLDRLAAEFADGDYARENDLPVLFAAFEDGSLAAVGGLTADPYDPAPDLVRLRHVYVDPRRRRGGIGRLLAGALVEQGLALVPRLSLRAADRSAGLFWEAQGFRRDLSATTRTHLLTR